MIRNVLRSARLLLLSVCAVWPGVASAADEVTREVDLLVVGGSESAVAATVQAARLGVPRIAIVNDIAWLGGQFTAEGLGAVDEWTIYHGRREPFPRSGLFLEIMNRIEQRMRGKYGHARPGNSFCAWTTCEPRETERLFRELLAPYQRSNGGSVELFEDYEPVAVDTADERVTGVRFVSTKSAPPLAIRATLTIDASDWGDVIRLSGARYLRGPDLKSAFNEPSAPTDASQVEPNEMNPITYCMVLRESDRAGVIDPPRGYDPRTYFGATIVTAEQYKAVGWPKGTMGPFARPWIESEMKNGPYGETPSVYTHRRLVDRRHLNLPVGSELVLVNWPLQDYPTYNFPRHVNEALEANEPGASRKNLVDMTPSQRRIVFDDAKRHTLGLLHYLQTLADSSDDENAVSFRRMELTDDFGTADRLPWKPYVREGLRLDALYMLRETDVRDRDGVQSWADHMVHDNVFGFQFNIDFHPTKRIFLNDDNTGPWAHIHSSYRHWGTHTDRAGFPLRCLVPARFDGLLGAGKNLGYTSIVSSAVRLHGHGMMAGQAAATVAAVALDERRTPREVAARIESVRQVQSLLVEPPVDRFTGQRPPGVLLWPYHDLPTDADCFEAVNQLSVRTVLVGSPGQQDFRPSEPIPRREVARAAIRAALATGSLTRHIYAVEDNQRRFRDVDFYDPDYAAIETLAAQLSETNPASLGTDGKETTRREFKPDHPADELFVREVFTAFDWKNPPAGEPITRSNFAIGLWDAIREHDELAFASSPRFESSDVDLDGDGRTDRDDPLPFDRDNDSVPDLLDSDNDEDGLADGVKPPPFTGRRFNFAGP
ncbi:MAG: FAD-dependent oxidoreductase, partial [Planctomycetales bacterium]|nr:FAD-dependent oxidoreductase [Planctomycetales bacterium]